MCARVLCCQGYRPLPSGALPVRFQVVFEVSRPGERPAAALERAAQELLGKRAAAPRRRLPLVSVFDRVLCVVT